MSVLQWLFGFHGRISAAKFRQGGALGGFIAGILFAASGAAITNAPAFDPRAKIIALGVIWGTLIVLLVWSNAALQAKRLHDRGRSGFLSLISVFVFLIWAGLVGYLGIGSMQPAEGDTEGVARIVNTLDQGFEPLMAISLLSILVSFWVFVDLGMMPGTPGPNQFGPEPGAPNASPLTPSGGAPSGPRQSWFAPKAHSWDVSGAEAAIAKAIAERNSSGAATAGETWQENANAQISNASGRSAFGRRN